MTQTRERAPAPVEGMVRRPSLCEAEWQCPNCRTEERCAALAETRLTVLCSSPGCDHAAFALLACGGCADGYTAQYGADRFVRRPL